MCLSMSPRSCGVVKDHGAVSMECLCVYYRMKLPNTPTALRTLPRTDATLSRIGINSLARKPSPNQLVLPHSLLHLD